MWGPLRDIYWSKVGIAWGHIRLVVSFSPLDTRIVTMIEALNDGHLIYQYNTGF